MNSAKSYQPSFGRTRMRRTMADIEVNTKHRKICKSLCFPWQKIADSSDAWRLFFSSFSLLIHSMWWRGKKSSWTWISRSFLSCLPVSWSWSRMVRKVILNQSLTGQRRMSETTVMQTWKDCTISGKKTRRILWNRMNCLNTRDLLRNLTCPTWTCQILRDYLRCPRREKLSCCSPLSLETLRSKRLNKWLVFGSQVSWTVI